MLRIGLVGLPNAGKSTLFNALVRGHAATAPFPFTTVDPNVGVVALPDAALAAVARVVGSATVTPASLEVVDIAGLVEGAHRGEGLGNRFLAHIREVDAIVHVVRCFTASDVPHPTGEIAPERDIDIVTTELLCRDLETVDAHLDRLSRLQRAGDRDAARRAELVAALREALAAGTPARAVPDPAQVARELALLTSRPVVYAANVDEDALADGVPAAVRARAAAEDAPTVAVAAALEAELATLTPEEQREYLSAYGLTRRGTEELIDAARRVLRLVTFYTANEREARAWLVPEGTTMVEAAGRIHSDMARGFIRADVIDAEALTAAGSEAEARARGLVRSEGRDAPVRDREVVLIRFRA